MEWLGHELVPFEDVLCQMLDMLKPKNKSGSLKLQDFLQTDKIKIAGMSSLGLLLEGYARLAAHTILGFGLCSLLPSRRFL